MKSPRSKARGAAQAAKVAARGAQSSGVVKYYVESFPGGLPGLRLREKVTRRIVRVLTEEPMYREVAPMANLLQDCFGHGGGLV